jgi:hypothetical protein
VLLLPTFVWAQGVAPSRLIMFETSR